MRTHEQELCLAARDAPGLTREHIYSRPITTSYGPRERERRRRRREAGPRSAMRPGATGLALAGVCMDDSSGRLGEEARAAIFPGPAWHFIYVERLEFWRIDIALI